MEYRRTMGFGVPYHGWKFNEAGKCIEMPAEPADSTFKDKVTVKAYQVEELGGLIFAYLGPKPVPLLPRWEIFVRPDAFRDIGVGTVPCNWLQIMENSLDPVHVEWLHQHFHNYVLERLGRSEEQGDRQHHEKIGFSVFEHGIIKRRILEGETEENEDWQVGHPVVFPVTLLSGSTRRSTFQIRVPIDDTHTMHWWYSCYAARPGVEATRQEGIPFYQVPVPGDGENGQPEWSVLDNNSGQDIAMWYTQGPIADRSLEKLGESDQGIIVYRKLLQEQLDKVARGEDPMNTFRDPKQNVCIKLRLEEAKLARGRFHKRPIRKGGTTKYSPFLDEEASRSEKTSLVPSETGA